MHMKHAHGAMRRNSHANYKEKYSPRVSEVKSLSPIIIMYICTREFSGWLACWLAAACYFKTVARLTKAARAHGANHHAYVQY